MTSMIPLHRRESNIPPHRHRHIASNVVCTLTPFFVPGELEELCGAVAPVDTELGAVETPGEGGEWSVCWGFYWGKCAYFSGVMSV